MFFFFLSFGGGDGPLHIAFAQVFLLVLASVDQLIHSLVQKVYIGHAFDLLDRHPAATPELHAERRARLHVIAGAPSAQVRPIFSNAKNVSSRLRRGQLSVTIGHKN